MATSLINIAEQCKSILGKGSLQELLEAVKNAYSSVVFEFWALGKKEGVSEINGSFITTYKDLKPAYDEEVEMYYIEIPSSYLELPHETGINHVSYMKGQSNPFVRLGNGAYGLISNLKSFLMGGNQVFFVDGNKMYFPKMKNTDVLNKGETRGLLLRLAVSLDTADVDEQLNISPVVVDKIVALVVERYNPKEKGVSNALI